MCYYDLLECLRLQLKRECFREGGKWGADIGVTAGMGASEFKLAVANR